MQPQALTTAFKSPGDALHNFTKYLRKPPATRHLSGLSRFMYFCPPSIPSVGGNLFGRCPALFFCHLGLGAIVLSLLHFLKSAACFVPSCQAAQRSGRVLPANALPPPQKMPATNANGPLGGAAAAVFLHRLAGSRGVAPVCCAAMYCVVWHHPGCKRF